MNADGVPDLITVNSWANDGWLRSAVTYEPGLDQVRSYRFLEVREDGGFRVEEHDLIANHLFAYTAVDYDESGRPGSMALFDDLGTSRCQQQYDDSGRLVGRTCYSGISGTTQLTFGYDGQGRVNLQQVDVPAEDTFMPDRVPDNQTRLEYDSAGRVVVVTYDEHADGTPDIITHQTWDDQGHLIERTVDLQADGTIDHRYAYHYELGDQGEVLSRTLDLGGDSRVEQQTRYLYDCP